MLKKLKTMSRHFSGFAAILLAVMILLSLVSFQREDRPIANAEEPAAFSKTSMSLTNGSFGDTEGSGIIAQPASWSGAVLGENASKGSTLDGVIDLSPDKFNTYEVQDAVKLNMYDDNKESIPKSSPASPSDENKVLMINTNNANVAYGFTSYSLTLEANSFYKFSIWVRTGEFSEGGASITLNGLKNNVCINDINTQTYLRNVGYTGDFRDINTNEDRKFGWVNYAFFIETSTMYDSSVSITLGVGNNYSFEDKFGVSHQLRNTAQGYALFDEVSVYKYAPTDFDRERSLADKKKQFVNPHKEADSYYTNENETILYYSESNAHLLSMDDEGNLLKPGDAGYEASEVGSFNNNASGWDCADNSSDSSLITGPFNDYADTLGLKDVIAYSPNGNTDNIALFTSYDKNRDAFRSISVGYKTRSFIVKRQKRYKLSVWVKTVGGKIARAAVSGYDYRGANVGVSPSNPEYGKGQLRVETDFEEGSTDNRDARNGWKEIAFFLRGSYFTDYAVQLEIWLGSKDEKKGGVAMFDNVRIEEITNTEYMDYSGKGKPVIFDKDPEDASVFSNGSFNELEDHPNYNGLYNPLHWTRVIAGQDETDGMSTIVPNDSIEDYVVSGVVSSDAHNVTVSSSKTYTSFEEKVIPINTHKYSDTVSNMLMIKADESTLPDSYTEGVAVGYRSANFGVGSDSIYKIEVTLCAETEGYGASIVLKDENSILTSIENITSTGGKYNTYTFMIQTGDQSLTNPRVEIWLGLYDKINNRQKLSRGTVFVDSVSIEELTISVTAAKEEEEEKDENDARPKVKELTEEEKQQNLNALALFQEQSQIYITDPKNGKVAIYSNVVDNLYAFDTYSPDFVKTPYNFSLTTNNEGAVTYGIFDGTAVQSNGDTPDAHAGLYWNGGYSHNGAPDKYALIIKNNVPTYSNVKSKIRYTLKSGYYYKFSIIAKISVPGDQASTNYKGAYMSLVGETDGTTYALSDMRSTATVTTISGETDNFESDFKVFTVYLKASGEVAEEAEKQTKQNFSIEFGIGGQQIDQYAKGTFIIAGIAVEESTNAEAEEAQKLMDASGTDRTPYAVFINLSSTETEEENKDKEDENKCDMSNSWYIYSSILLVVALLVAGIALLVRHFAIKRKRIGTEVESSRLSYDRDYTLVKQHNILHNDEETIDELSRKETYDLFDEDLEREIAERKRLEKENEELSEEFAAFIPEDTVIDEVPSVDEAEEVESPAEFETEIEPEQSKSAVEEDSSAEEESQPTEQTEEVAETEQTEEEIDYNEIVDFASAARAKKAAKELEREKEKEQALAQKQAETEQAEEEKRRVAKAKADKRKFDEWDDFDD
ncbi:MAG: hypothetical protein J6X29_03055 [Clostridia bacterium]|nr:hypothetical protein [Clostridia bacterium]